MPGPLAGVRVLELARILAGPWAGQVLADLGADVIKVERSKTGDDTRAWGPPFVEAKDGGHLGAAYFHATNRGKRSIECDFESEEGKKLVRKLAAKSDILIENFKVGGLAKFGLDYKSLAKECPRLIYCSVTGFGQDGPYATRAGYDLMAQGMGGFMSLTGLADGEPTRAGVPVSDIMTGMYSVIGILAAVGFPSYQQYTRKANRSSAQQLMLEIASKEAQYILDARQYTDIIGSGGLNIANRDNWTCTTTATPWWPVLPSTFSTTTATGCAGPTWPRP